ncbi:MAG: restriction endonuclease subunit S [Bacteroidaceae bacterium]|nr:restriction endonuclease subunit S [Bacteroidaceae bacterium]
MVEWKRIEEISLNVFAGGTPSTKHGEYYDGDIPWIRSGEIDFNVISSAERNITKAGYDNSSAKLIQKGSVVMAMTGATVAKSAIVEFETSANQSVCAIETDESVVNYKYLYYVLAKDYFRIKSSAQGALTSLNLAMIKQIEVPIPNITEQQRIVGILDTFTSSIDNLKEQIAQRRKQYEYYRDQLYYSSKEELMKAAKEGLIEVKSFDEIGTFTRGRRFVRTDIVEEGVPCIHYGDMYTYYGISADTTPTYLTKEVAAKLRYASKGDVVIVAAGENDLDIGVGVAWLGENDVVVHDACFIFKHEMDSKYISHYLRSRNYHQQIRMGVVDGKICSISAKELGRTLIPVPSLSEQQRIVGILDTFEASIQNLEAQLKEREKQYEYYRNKLLTFE